MCTVVKLGWTASIYRGDIFSLLAAFEVTFERKTLIHTKRFSLLRNILI